MTGNGLTNTRARRSLPRSPDSLTIVFAHPDDEVLFFLGWIRTLRPAKLRLICATGDFGDETAQRRAEFGAVAEFLCGEGICLGLEDRRAPRGDPIGAPLDQRQLAAALAKVHHAKGNPVLSHGPAGEYGHRHHVDVFRAAWRRFGDDLWCAAGPLEIHESHALGQACADEKLKLIDTLYVSQNGIDQWGCGDEPLCHVASSRFAPVFGAHGDGTQNAAPGRPARQLIADYLDCLERSYVGPDRRLPSVMQTIHDRWPAPLLDQWLAARIEDWRSELSEDS